MKVANLQYCISFFGVFISTFKIKFLSLRYQFQKVFKISNEITYFNVKANLSICINSRAKSKLKI